MSRRHRITRSLTLVAVPAIALAGCVFGDDDTDSVMMYPIDDSRAANAETTISFRGATADDLDDLVVTGSASGEHDGELVDHPDGEGVSFRPDRRFEPGEMVVVTTDIDLLANETDDATDGIGFRVSTNAEPPDELPTGGTSDLPEPEVLEFATMPEIRVPQATVEGDVGSSVFLATPRSLGDSTAGASIIDQEGELVWWQPTSDDEVTVGNLAVHEIDGEPVLAWFEGTAPFGVGKYVGEWIVVDSTYSEVTRIPGANGIPADIHDLTLTDRGTALVVAYHPVTMDLTEDGGSDSATVLDSVVQEIDLDTGDVYFEWHSVDEVPIADTRIDDVSAAVVDYAHINSVAESPDGNVLISLRHTSQVMEIDRATGDPIWILGGDSNTIDTGDDTGISYPHHARFLPDGTLSVFDNGVERDDPTSRGVVYELDEDGDAADVVATFAADPPVYTATQGSIQVVGDESLAMWSELGIATRFDEDANPTGTIDLGTGSYRLFATDWIGRPALQPAAVAEGGAISVSWNGATEVEQWEVLADGEVVASMPADGFETRIDIASDVVDSDAARALEVRALDAASGVLPGSTITIDAR